MLEGLAAVHAAGEDIETIAALTKRIHEEKALLAPGCAACETPCGRSSDYDMEALWNSREPARSLRSRLLFCLEEMASSISLAGGYGTLSTGAKSGLEQSVIDFLYIGLFAVGYEYYAEENLISLVETAEKTNMTCAQILAGHPKKLRKA